MHAMGNPAAKNSDTGDGQRAVLVTGAAKRIGRVLALALAADGVDVAITYSAVERCRGRDGQGAPDTQGARSGALRCVRDPERM